MTSTEGPIITRQGGRSLLESVFKFKDASKLCKFIEKKGGISKPLFTLAEIITIIKETVMREGLYDERNPPLIMCSEELESAINMKALHSSEMLSIVLRQLQIITNEEFLERYCQDLVGSSRPTSTNHLADFTSNTTHRLIGLPLGNFTCKPEFLNIVQPMLKAEKDKKVFTFKEIVSLFIEHVMSHKAKFIDPRNPKVAIIKGDPLESVFQVSAFHSCQTTYFVRRQLIPHIGENGDKYNGPPAGRADPIVLSPQAVDAIVRLRTGATTVARSTISEYEPDSEDEEDRPQLAGGRPVVDGVAKCSDSDSDTGQNFVLRKLPPIDPMTDVPYWGEISDLDDPFQSRGSEQEKFGIKTCVECGSRGSYPLKLCPPCWKTRRDWTGSHIRKRKREPQHSNKHQIKDSELQTEKAKELSGDAYPEPSKREKSPSNSSRNVDLCLFCCERPRDASFVHGRIGHQVCCYRCAKKTWIKGYRCPVCKRTTEKIIRVVSS